MLAAAFYGRCAWPFRREGWSGWRGVGSEIGPAGRVVMRAARKPGW